MLRQGVFPASVHGVVEYGLGALFVAAPFLLGFDSSAATAASIVVGVLLLVAAASSQTKTALAPLVPSAIHVLFDLVLAGFLIAAPFLFGFSDERNPTAFFIVAGVVHLLLAIGTRFVEDDPLRTA